MELILQAQEAAQSSAGIRRFWYGGGDGKPPQFAVTLNRTPEGQSYLDEPFSILAHSANEFSEFFLAMDIADYGLTLLAQHPAKDDPAARRVLNKLGHAKAMALLRTGSVLEGQQLLKELSKQTEAELEITAALARSHKDLAFLAGNRQERNEHLAEALRLYLAAYKPARDIFPGINAAAIALWLDKRAEAENLAREIEVAAEAKASANASDYWLMATLAEAQLILGKKEAAAENYGRARRLIEPSRKWANLEATLKQARRICAHLNLDFSFLEKVFRFPQVIVFSGHMFDAPDRISPRFPESMEAYVRAELQKRLEKLNPGIGVCSAACGADFLFIEEMLARGADVRIVLPWPKEDFIRSSVGAKWKDRFSLILEKATATVYLSQQTEPKKSNLGYEYLNQSICGLAIIGSKLVGAKLVPMAVWDTKPGDGLGGTASFVSFWHKLGLEPEVIALPSIHSNERLPSQPAPEEADDTSLTLSRGHEAIKTMLFADVLGYTKIPAQVTERFVNCFLGKISSLMDAAPQRPVMANTWGDAIYLVFDDVIAAGQFALQLSDLVERTDWVAEGLGTQLRLRISLHTGPVLLCVDPIIRQMNAMGSHVSHAARIEPIVNPGQVWASEGFAAHSAIAAMKRDPGYRLDYLGQKEFSKKYGAYSLFQIKPRQQ